MLLVPRPLGLGRFARARTVPQSASLLTWMKQTSRTPPEQHRLSPCTTHPRHRDRSTHAHPDLPIRAHTLHNTFHHTVSNSLCPGQTPVETPFELTLPSAPPSPQAVKNTSTQPARDDHAAAEPQARLPRTTASRRRPQHRHQRPHPRAETTGPPERGTGETGTAANTR